MQKKKPEKLTGTVIYTKSHPKHGIMQSVGLSPL